MGNTLLAAIASAVALLASPAHAADAWPTGPTGPIKLIVPYPPGGSSDNVGRPRGSRREQGWRRRDDRHAGRGARAGRRLHAATCADRSDGDPPHVRALPYAASDFTPVATVAGSYSLVAARKDLPANNMAELTALAKKQPSKLTFGSAGLATATHMADEMVHLRHGIQLLHVPYKGSGESLNALVSGQFDVIDDPIALPQVLGGTVKALAVSGKSRHPELPNVLTLKEQEIDVSVGSWFGLFAPKGTPEAIVDRLAVAIEKPVNAPGVEKQLSLISLYPEFRGPKAFAKQVKDDSAFYKGYIG